MADQHMSVASVAEESRTVGKGSHGIVLEVPGDPNTVVKVIAAIKLNGDEACEGSPYFSADAAIEPAAIRRLNGCLCPFVVEMKRVEVDEAKSTVEIYMERLEPLIGNTCKMGLAEMQRTVSQLVAGVASMNACGVYHRDIKLANVMRTPSTSKAPIGDVRIIDFSLALLDHPRLTSSSDVMYTLNYRAPEVILSYKHYDRDKAEAWALGVTCAEIMLGLEEHNLFRGLKWYHVLSGIMEAFPGYDFCGAYSFYPGWNEFVDRELCREGWWRYGKALGLWASVKAMCGAAGADFVLRACDPNPDKRWTPAMLMAHPYVRDGPYAHAYEPERLRMPRSLAVTRQPLYSINMEGLADDRSNKSRDRRALAEELLRFVGMKASDVECYEGAIVVLGAMCAEQVRGFRPPSVMKVLAAAGIVEFFSRHVYVLINEGEHS